MDRARSKTRRTLEAVSPRKLPITASYLTANKGAFSDSAIASARVVFPLPGGPQSRTRWRGSKACERNRSALRCSSTNCSQVWRTTGAKISSSIRRFGVSVTNRSLIVVPEGLPNRAVAGGCEPFPLDARAFPSLSARIWCCLERSSAIRASVEVRKRFLSPLAPALTNATNNIASRHRLYSLVGSCFTGKSRPFCKPEYPIIPRPTSGRHPRSSYR